MEGKRRGIMKRKEKDERKNDQEGSEIWRRSDEERHGGRGRGRRERKIT